MSPYQRFDDGAMTIQVPRNRLAGETSPYLLQHADNPVDWYPWGPEALAKAVTEDKPILLSIGYSACHWCHVMAHESFEHAPTAELMNHLFVNIKVDREERPDLDRIYQTALQLLSRRTGGWPLTMFLAPDTRVPFFGGTYFPREPRYGIPAFREVLERVAAFYRSQRNTLEEQNAELMQAFRTLGARAAGPGKPEPSVLDMARHQLEHGFDPHHGGFGGAPKFPQPTNLTRLLRYYATSLHRGHGDERALHMAIFTLEKMAHGGIFDQIGGGFCRYSVDGQWTIPHFEKMLYDNALLLPLYAGAFRLNGNPLFGRIVIETADWVLREMQSPDGGYFSSLDADSEGEEGKYYVWTAGEVRDLLDPAVYPLFARRFGLDQAANFEQRWHLRVTTDIETLARESGLDSGEARRRIDRARGILHAARERRVRPGRDDKILTSWNALMIRGLMIAARELGHDALRTSAERAIDFIRAQLWRDDRLLATCKDGRSHLPAYLDDHAFLLDALLEALQTRWRKADIAFAIELADALLDHFEDPQHGGFFFTSHDHEQLIHRPKPWGDDALPSGNGIAARALIRLGHLLGETRYNEAGERTLRGAWRQISELPYAHNTLLDALEEYLHPPQIIVIRGDESVADGWLAACRAGYHPDRIAVAIPNTHTALPGLLGERRAPAAGALAYICSGTSCQAPVDTLEALREALRDNSLPKTI
jgi:uncharacterized protein